MTNASSLTASFGDVQIGMLDETKAKTLPIQVHCPAGPSLRVSLAISPDAHSTTIAKTNVANLGISMLWGNNNFTANLQGQATPSAALSGTVT